MATTLTQVLQMTFRCSDESKVTISVDDCKDDLTATTIKAAMNNIILESAFEYDGADLAAPAGAKIVKKEVEVQF